MSTKTEELVAQVFSNASKTDWQKAASAEIAGEDPFVKLQWQTTDGLTFSPYYNTEDLKELAYRKSFVQSRKDDTSWRNVPNVTVKDASLANTIALEHLQGEADGVIFTLTGTTDLNKLLAGIQWPHCTVSFIVPSAFNLEALVLYAKEKSYHQQELHGALFREAIPKATTVLAFTKFKEFGLYIPPSIPTEEIALALQKGVEAIETLEAEGLTRETIFESIAFSIPVSANFLQEISKLKALRMLWYQIAQAYGISSYKQEDLYIHTRSEVWINEKFQPHGNMLNSALATMAALAGGCQAHTAYPENEDDLIMRRIARNHPVLLKEESHFDKVSDPVAGAYAVEVMTDAIAKKAWELFSNR